jgi:hypothetical protein
MNLSKDVEADFKKLNKYRNKIRRQSKRMLDIMDFLEVEIKNNHPEELVNYKIDIDFYQIDLKLIIKQKDIENYKSELYTMAYDLSDWCKDIGLKKIPFIRKYKIWVLLKK